MLSSVNNHLSTQLHRNYINNSNPATPINASFLNALFEVAQKVETTDTVLAELRTKYGAQVYLEAPPNPQENNYQSQLNSLASRTFGTNNIVIAPNMLEKMANDPEVKQHCMKQIQSYFDSIPSGAAFLAANGRQIVSSGVIVHEDGTVTSWCSADYTPEENARLERKMKEEDEEKAKKRAEHKRYLEIAHAESSQLPSSLEALTAFQTQSIHSYADASNNLANYVLSMFRFQNTSL